MKCNFCGNEPTCNQYYGPSPTGMGTTVSSPNSGYSFTGKTMGYYITEQEYQEFLEYKKWLNTPCCELVEDLDEHPCYAVMESFISKFAGSKPRVCVEKPTQHTKSTLSSFYDYYQTLNDGCDQETLEDIIEDLRGDVRTLRKDLDAQILINKVKK